MTKKLYETINIYEFCSWGFMIWSGVHRELWPFWPSLKRSFFKALLCSFDVKVVKNEIIKIRILNMLEFWPRNMNNQNVFISKSKNKVKKILIFFNFNKFLTVKFFLESQGHIYAPHIALIPINVRSLFF